MWSIFWSLLVTQLFRCAWNDQNPESWLCWRCMENVEFDLTIPSVIQENCCEKKCSFRMHGIGSKSLTGGSSLPKIKMTYTEHEQRKSSKWSSNSKQKKLSLCKIFFKRHSLPRDRFHSSFSNSYSFFFKKKLVRWRLKRISSILRYFSDFLRAKYSEIPISLGKHLMKYHNLITFGTFKSVLGLKPHRWHFHMTSNHWTLENANCQIISLRQLSRVCNGLENWEEKAWFAIISLPSSQLHFYFKHKRFLTRFLLSATRPLAMKNNSLKDRRNSTNLDSVLESLSSV